MVIKREVARAKVANIAGVSLAPRGRTEASVEAILERRPVDIPLVVKPTPPQVRIPPAPGRPELPLPEVKNIRTTELKSDFARVEWDVARMPGLAYKVWLDGVAIGAAVTKPRIELAGLKPVRRYKVEIRTQPHSKMDRRSTASKKVTYYFTTPPAVTPSVPPVVTLVPQKPPMPPIPAVKIPVPLPKIVPMPKPSVKIPPKDQVWYFDDEMLRCEVLSPDESIPKSTHKFTNRRDCIIALMKHKEDTRKITPKMPAEIARRVKRKVSARVEELMEKRAFPKAVKEAIEKGLERKDAPANIERIIEKVAKTNVPDYILRRTIAKRIGREGIVQYKVDTDKGTIIYQNADEKDVNAILGMQTPTGEVIPLQIKVIR